MNLKVKLMIGVWVNGPNTMKRYMPLKIKPLAKSTEDSKNLERLKFFSFFLHLNSSQNPKRVWK